MRFQKRRNVIRAFCNSRLLILVLLLAFSLTTASSQKPSRSVDSETETRREKLVWEFVAAFNAHDSRRMLEMADENIQWVSVDGAKISLETDGAKALRENMDGYFKRCHSCKSTLEWVQSTKNRVVTLERAEWMTRNGLESQKSLAVYEFRNDKILRVYYFPAETSSQ